MRRHNTTFPLPTGPMVRMLRRIAQGKRMPVLKTKPTTRGYALILAGLVERGLIEPAAPGTNREYQLTAAGHAVLNRTRSSLR